MATQNLTAGETKNNHAGQRTAFVVEQIVDFSINNAAASDVIQMLNVYPGWFVETVLLEVLTVEGAARTANVGDGVTPTGFLTAANLNALGMTKPAQAATLGGTGAAGDPIVLTGYTFGKLFTVADTLDLVVSGTLSAAKVRLAALIIDMT